MKWTIKQIFCWHKWEKKRIEYIQSAGITYGGWMKVCSKCKKFKEVSDESNSARYLSDGDMNKNI